MSAPPAVSPAPSAATLAKLTPVLTRRWGVPDAWRRERYEELDGYRALRKALAARPDMVTVDLEDAVIPAQKDEARARSMPLFEATRADGIEQVVRINGMRTPFGLKDLLAIVEHPSPPDAIMLPKVESADEVRIVDALLQRAARPVGLHVIIESNAGLEEAIAIGGACPRIRSPLRSNGTQSTSAACAANAGATRPSICRASTSTSRASPKRKRRRAAACSITSASK